MPSKCKNDDETLNFFFKCNGKQLIISIDSAVMVIFEIIFMSHFRLEILLFVFLGAVVLFSDLKVQT